jgi:hypothetical protein
MDALGLGGIDDTRSAEDVAHANFSKEVDLGDKVIIGGKRSRVRARLSFRRRAGFRA